MSSMPLTAHLGELRKRLVRCLLVIALAFLGLFPFAQTLYTLISEPLRRYLPEGASMIATSVTSPFLAPFKLTMMVAVFLCMPVLLHQAWGFVAPGLYRRERRIAVPLLVSSILLFYAGMAFAFFAVFPMMFGFFASVTPDGVEMMTDIALYLDFILALFLAFGLAFEIPVATFIIVWAGLTDVDTLRRSRPYVIVGCFVVGMLLTPPDVFSQTMLAVPMWLLFEVGLIACGSIQRRPKQEGEQELAVTE
ncbi:twin-arginine translocase subunit TatC [Phytopseudomonas dryadis]|uniref:Sec-independent protein translocase protein TatC n=1 Tax=Phytopseudomonas dryadis TaxID=2487520 RepID=A0A4Q9R572_9GAMM|nr:MULTISPECIES: twin-arginine translocase subunit TatC [Pseudomonas]TBU95676.1 twin-arginine translocase subunit TatC [Pseudomonas dryadis]TBV06712.1 twin-arginine translocase subunit TatC [Pseudomonas dryadis]TBV18547.1 twin-arginine translocase subunit TatC [Pseudomonas sp. FRB 230]